MKITRQHVEDVAQLSRLELGEEEMSTYTEQLNNILEYATMLDELVTEGIQPTAHVLPIHNVMRTDETKPSLPREEALANAPEQEDGYFKVPKIMEG